jgi:hypothetical protein
MGRWLPVVEDSQFTPVASPLLCAEEQHAAHVVIRRNRPSLLISAVFVLWTRLLTNLY